MSWPVPSPSSAFVARRQRLASELASRGVEAAILPAGMPRPRNFLANPHPFRAESHFLYLVGRPLPGAYLVLTPRGATLFAEPPDPEEALWSGPQLSLENLAAELAVDVRSVDDIAVPAGAATLPPHDGLSAALLGDVLGRDVLVGSGPDLTGDDAALADAIISLRLRHDDAAIAQLRQAATVTVAAHAAGRERVAVGRREAAVRAAMEAVIIEHGMEPAYGSIVTRHGEILHAERYDGTLEAGDLLLADVGAETPEGFAGDVTRVWPASGALSGAQCAIYEVVLDAQKAAIEAVRPGAAYRDVHRLAGRRLVEGLVDLGILKGDPDDLAQRGASSLFFPHGVGHLLGLDVHDMEDLGDRAGYAPDRRRGDHGSERYLRMDRDLEPGMAVTIEPGFYQNPLILAEARRGDLSDVVNWTELKKYRSVRGIRIEDDVLVTKDAPEVLTAGAPKAPY